MTQPATNLSPKTKNQPNKQRKKLANIFLIVPDVEAQIF